MWHHAGVGTYSGYAEFFDGYAFSVEINIGANSDPDSEVRAYLLGKLMRQAKPDDVFSFASPRTIRELWPRLERYLGKSREFWTWLFDTWERQGHVWR